MQRAGLIFTPESRNGCITIPSERSDSDTASQVIGLLQIVCNSSNLQAFCQTVLFRDFPPQLER